MKRTIIRKASDIFDDEYESPAFIIEDEKQTKTGYWLVAESDQEYAQWYVDLPSARKAMKEEKIRSNAARALGSIKSPKKAASSRENGKLGGRPKIEKIAINIHRPFHNTAYDARIFVPKNNLLLSGDQYRKIYLHHKKSSDCQCGVEITDDSGKSYGVIPSDRDNNKYYLFEF